MNLALPLLCESARDRYIRGYAILRADWDEQQGKTVEV